MEKGFPVEGKSGLFKIFLKVTSEISKKKKSLQLLEKERQEAEKEVGKIHLNLNLKCSQGKDVRQSQIPGYQSAPIDGCQVSDGSISNKCLLASVSEENSQEDLKGKDAGPNLFLNQCKNPHILHHFIDRTKTVVKSQKQTGHTAVTQISVSYGPKYAVPMERALSPLNNNHP